MKKPNGPHSAHVLEDPANRAHIEASLAAFDRGEFTTSELSDTPAAAELYKTDRYQWMKAQAEALDNGDFTGLDPAGLIEFLNAERTLWISLFKESVSDPFSGIIMAWLLQDEDTQRDQAFVNGDLRNYVGYVRDHLAQYPSMLPDLITAFAESWAAVAEDENTAAGAELFPLTPVWALDTILAAFDAGITEDTAEDFRDCFTIWQRRNEAAVKVDLKDL